MNTCLKIKCFDRAGKAVRLSTPRPRQELFRGLSLLCSLLHRALIAKQYVRATVADAKVVEPTAYLMKIDKG